MQKVEIVDLKASEKDREKNRKNKKIAEIEGGFISSNGHSYSFTSEDQLSMLLQREELREIPSITEVMWETKDAGLVKHRTNEWIKVYQEALQYRRNKLNELTKGQ